MHNNQYWLPQNLYELPPAYYTVNEKLLLEKLIQF
jgi:hypothetical protein